MKYTWVYHHNLNVNFIIKTKMYRCKMHSYIDIPFCKMYLFLPAFYHKISFIFLIVTFNLESIPSCLIRYLNWFTILMLNYMVKTNQNKIYIKQVWIVFLTYSHLIFTWLCAFLHTLNVKFVKEINRCCHCAKYIHVHIPSLPKISY